MAGVFKKILGGFVFVMVGLLLTSNVSTLDFEELANKIAPNNTVEFNSIKPDDGMELDFFTQIYVDDINELYGNESVYTLALKENVPNTSDGIGNLL